MPESFFGHGALSGGSFMNVYLDYAATTPLDGEVLEEMLPLLKENFGNPDSLHSYGRKSAYAVTSARDRVARVLGVKPSEVYFTSGGTEADNWAVRALAPESGRSACVSAIEHHAVLGAAELLGKDRVTYAFPDENGIVTAEAVSRAMREDTGVVCVMAVNNETGCLQPLEEISALCASRGAILFSDCVQAASVLDLRAVCALCGAISLSGHKIYGPKGTGVLVVRKGIKISPLIAGGEQERGLRGGTLNPAGIVGFAAALERAQAEREAFSSRVRALRDLFEKRVLSGLNAAVRIDGENRAPNISHLTFGGIGADALVNLLDLSGVAVSGGAACSARSALPSHVLLAMGRSEEEARRGLRVSFGKHTTEEETVFAADTVISCVKKLRS